MSLGSPLEVDGGEVEAVRRLLRLGESSVGHAESTKAHPIRLLAKIRDLPPITSIRTCEHTYVWRDNMLQLFELQDIYNKYIEVYTTKYFVYFYLDSLCLAEIPRNSARRPLGLSVGSSTILMAYVVILVMADHPSTNRAREGDRR